MGIFREHVGHSWRVLEDALRDFEEDSLDYPIMRGLADVLSSRAAFDRKPPVDPVELREMLVIQGASAVERCAVVREE
ncbi:MAG: DUF790 family protein, partial [Candidatus Promineifilaceae bacterium]